jgi:hypothetical protein
LSNWSIVDTFAYLQVRNSWLPSTIPFGFEHPAF